MFSGTAQGTGWLWCPSGARGGAPWDMGACAAVCFHLPDTGSDFSPPHPLLRAPHAARITRQVNSVRAADPREAGQRVPLFPPAFTTP